MVLAPIQFGPMEYKREVWEESSHTLLKREKKKKIFFNRTMQRDLCTPFSLRGVFSGDASALGSHFPTTKEVQDHQRGADPESRWH